MKINKKQKSILPLYYYIKKYFLFYFPEYSAVYFSSNEIQRLYELVQGKKKRIEYKKWLELLESIKKSLPEVKVYDLESNNPSYTCKVIFPRKEKSNVQVFFSVSLICPFYILFIEDKPRIDERNITFSPRGKFEQLFIKIENKIEEFFPNFDILNWNFARANFFNLIVPGFNSSKEEDGLPNRSLTVLEGLFFEYDLNWEGFSGYIGDRNYRSSERMEWEVDFEKMEEVRIYLKNNKKTFKEI